MNPFKPQFRPTSPRPGLPRQAARRRIRGFRGALAATAVAALTATACAGVPGGPGGPGAPGAMSGLRVQGTDIVNGAGQKVRLLGVNRSGTEYACIQGWGFFDGPSDDASIAAIRSWKVNTVRVPLNETCWLGINGAPAQYSGAAYRQTIIDYVGRINRAGMAVVLDLHWTAAGTGRATGQANAPNTDHTLDFWRSVASTFKGNGSVLFDLYNEPHDISWTCWRDGGECGTGYRVAGMQQMINAVRETGARNIVLVAGNGWGGDLSGWLAHRPTDPAGNLAASWHMYDFGGCVTEACWDAQVAPVSAAVPLVAGEFGDTDCNHDFSDRIMRWLDAHADSYLGWAWNTHSCNSFPALISDWSGTPTGYGAGLRDHLARIAG